MATCPECDFDIEVDEYDVDKGDLLSCPECGKNLEVTGVTPVELDLVAEDEEEEEEEEVEKELGEEDEEKETEDWEE